MSKRKNKLAVVCHDAGGAEIISSYIRKNGLDCVYVLDGPAIKIFEGKLGKIENNKLVEVIEEADWLLCGTSWQSDLEWEAINLAAKNNIQSVVYLDHWVNYPARFIRNDISYFPDEVWVGDKYAEAIAKQELPNQNIELVKNTYFEDLKDQLHKHVNIKRTGIGVNVLYVCEPIREHALSGYGDEYYWGYIEEDALRYFLDNMHLLNEKVANVFVRPHPSESIDKYDDIISEYDLPIYRCGNRTLFEEVAESDVVVGCESMAMVVGLLAGKRVISSIPPGGKTCELPQTEIEQLRLLG